MKHCRAISKPAPADDIDGLIYAISQLILSVTGMISFLLDVFSKGEPANQS